MPFLSPRLAGDPVLEACLAGTHRMMQGESGAAVRKVQQALIDLGYGIPDGPTGMFGPQTADAVVRFKTHKRLVPNDPVVGPGTSRALDADLVALDAGRAVPRPPPAPVPAQMHGKFFYGGEGAKVPYTDFGIGFALFKFWLRRNGRWRGYTAASNAGLGGFAILESPLVSFVAPDHPRLENLHTSVVEVAIEPSTFVKDGGVASLSLVVRTNTGTDPQLAFHADGVKGVSAVVGRLTFTTTLVELPADEHDPTGWRYVPW
jgi:hypothetical protein